MREAEGQYAGKVIPSFKEIQTCTNPRFSFWMTAVTISPSRSSGVLSSVTWANGLAVIPEGQVIRRGDEVDFLPFNELLT